MVSQETVVKAKGSRVKKFYRETVAELKKVSIPSKQEMISHTGVVFVAVVMAATVIWITDSVFSWGLRLFIK